MSSPNPALDATRAPARVAMRWALAAAAATCALGLLVAGPEAAAGAAVGGAAALAGGWTMLRGVRSALERSSDPRAARARAVAAALLRYPIIGAILALGILVLDVPAGWLVAGVSTWPVALAAAALSARAAEPSPSRG